MIFCLKHEITNELEDAESLRDIFNLVQTAVEKTINESRAGLNIGIMELGNEPNQFLGAFYPAGSNIIVLNSTPLRRIEETMPDLFKPYVFHVLLHEYLHSLGYLDERTARQICYDICRKMFGTGHIATKMALDIGKFMPQLIYPDGYPGNTNRMKLIENIDGGMDYIG